MLRNSILNTIPSYEGVVHPAIIDTLKTFFDCTSAEEAKANLSELHHAWGAKGCNLFKDWRDIANMVFFVNNVSELIREINRNFWIVPADLVNVGSSKGTYPSNAISFLNEALQTWICPEIILQWSAAKTEECGEAFSTMADFIDACNEVLEGGVSCAY
jgi:hypothetical protein